VVRWCIYLRTSGLTRANIIYTLPFVNVGSSKRNHGHSCIVETTAIARAHTMTQTQLEQVQLFAALPPEEAMALAASFRPRTYPAGTTLFREGEVGDHLYIAQRARACSARPVRDGALRGAASCAGHSAN
jgi:hypothetical protein